MYATNHLTICASHPDTTSGPIDGFLSPVPMPSFALRNPQLMAKSNAFLRDICHQLFQFEAAEKSGGIETRRLHSRSVTLNESASETAIGRAPPQTPKTTKLSPPTSPLEGYHNRSVAARDMMSPSNRQDGSRSPLSTPKGDLRNAADHLGFKNACENCSRAKTKCDGVRPICGRCSSKKTACQYSLRKRCKGSGSKSPSASESKMEVVKSPTKVSSDISPRRTKKLINGQLKKKSSLKDNLPKVDVWCKRVDQALKPMLQQESLTAIMELGNESNSKIQMKCFSYETLPKMTLQYLFDLTKSNMEHVYNENASNDWGSWDDAKEMELFQDDEMVFWVFYEIDEVEKCEDVMNDVVCVVENVHQDAKKEYFDKLVNRIVGFVAFRFVVERDLWTMLYIHELQLVKRIRRSGVGRNILRLVDELASQVDTEFVILTVLYSNVSAFKFYEKCGFRVDEACPTLCYQADNIPYRIMSKMLSSRDTTNLHRCDICDDDEIVFRYMDSLTLHKCVNHEHPWPFSCRSCDLGSATGEQLLKHCSYCHSSDSGHSLKRRSYSKSSSTEYHEFELVRPRPEEFLEFRVKLQRIKSPNTNE